MILEETIKIVIEQQKERFLSKDSGLQRDIDLSLKSINSHAIIITGIRRCGKSTLLLQIINKLKGKNILYLNFESPQLYNFNIKDFNRLNNIIISKKYKYLFFDEIQLVEGWEMFIREKIDEGYKVLITGSNASLLSGELGTKLTGRHISYDLFPFSYKEFIKFKNIKTSPDALLNYIQLGGFPEFLKSKDLDQLNTLFDDVLIRDIITRYGIKDIKSLKQLALFLYSNIGNRITATKLKQILSVSATSTILTWFSYLESSYLIFLLPSYSTSVRAQIVNPKKIYAIDMGMVNSITSDISESMGRKLENTIYLHLRKNHKEIYYFDNKHECDFVTFKNGKVSELIQVCYQLTPDNLNREIQGLQNAMTYFKQKKGIIITFNQNDTMLDKYGEINVISADRFLLNQ